MALKFFRGFWGDFGSSKILQNLQIWDPHYSRGKSTKVYIPLITEGKFPAILFFRVDYIGGTQSSPVYMANSLRRNTNQPRANSIDNSGRHVGVYRLPNRHDRYRDMHPSRWNNIMDWGSFHVSLFRCLRDDDADSYVSYVFGKSTCPWKDLFQRTYSRWRCAGVMVDRSCHGLSRMQPLFT